MRQEDYQFWVYILASRSRTLYIGLTNSLRRRILEHREQPQGFTARYNINRLVYCEQFQYIDNAIAREKELKKWTRAQKIALIEAANPTWEDLMPDEPDQHFTKQIPFGNDKGWRYGLALRSLSSPVLSLYFMCHSRR